MKRRELLVSKGWVQAVLLVVLFGFFVLGLLAYRTYDAKPPIPQRVVDVRGQTLFTAEDVQKGQQTFLHNGLMEYGSVFGHGAYLGPDFTADYLRRSSDLVRRSYGAAGSDSATRRTIDDFRRNRYHERLGNTRAVGLAVRRPSPAGRLLQPLLLRADVQARAATRRDHGPRGAPPADGVLRLDGVGRPQRTDPGTTTPTPTTGRRSPA